jgi:hypothetical protein
MSAINNISLFVPHVFPNFTQKYVANAFARVGDVDRVDFVAKHDRWGKEFNAAYIHFIGWYDNELAREIQDNIAKDGSAEFYHQYCQYYWIVLPNTAKKHVPGERKPRIDLSESKPRMDLGESKSHSVKAVEKTPGKTNKPSKSVGELVAEFQEWYTNEASEETAQMAEIEAELEAVHENLISIDGRYVKAIEEENWRMRAEIAQLRASIWYYGYNA